MKNPWIRVTRPYDGGELALMHNTVNGKTAVNFVNKWGEVSTPMYNATINRLVSDMKKELRIS